MRRSIAVLVLLTSASWLACGGGDVTHGSATNGDATASGSSSTTGGTANAATTTGNTGTGTGNTTGTGTGTGTGNTTTGGSTGSSICSSQSCVVYASADHDLYQVDPNTLQESHLCTFGGALTSSTADVVTDIAVTPDGTLYAITETALYTVNPSSCAATKVSTLSQAGTRWVGLTFTAGNTLLAADGSGNVATIDTSTGTITPSGSFGGGLVCSGDIVAINDANQTVYASANGTSGNDKLVTLNPTTGAASVVGNIGYSSVFGLGFWAGKLYGFTHSGQILSIDPSSGAATVIGTESTIKFSGGATTPLAPVFQ